MFQSTNSLSDSCQKEEEKNQMKEEKLITIEFNDKKIPEKVPTFLTDAVDFLIKNGKSKKPIKRYKQ
jgi:hypothetical protein